MRASSLIPPLAWVLCVLVTLAGDALELETRGPFLLPLAETRLSVLAVHSPYNNVELRLVEPFINRNVTISLAMAKYDQESQISATGLNDDLAVVSHDKLDLKEQIISIFRKKNVVAVYRAGQYKPVLVYEYKGTKKRIDFGKYIFFYSSGPRGSYTIHTTRLEERGYGAELAQPHGAAVTNELHGIRREINRRLGIMNAFLNKRQIDKWSPKALKTIDKLLEELVMPHLFLLDYYGVKLKGRYKRYRKVVIGERRPAIKARIKAK